MKKITLLVSHKDVEASLYKLRKLGLLHISHMREPVADYISSLKERLLLLDKALLVKDQEGLSLLDKALAITTHSSGETKRLEKKDLDAHTQEIVDANSQREQLASRLETLEQGLAWFKDWGDVSRDQVEELKKAGVFIKLYIVSKGAFKRIPAEKLIYPLRRKGTDVYIAFLGLIREDSLRFPEIEIPLESLYSVERKISRLHVDLEFIDKRINKLCEYGNAFIQYRKELLKGLEFYNVRFGMAVEEGICCLQGFLPAESVAKVSESAQRLGWAIVIEEPTDPDQVPTLIRNPKWVEAIRPVFQFMGSLPGYKEYDISSWFFLFFSLFFAMLIGDAGYGLLFLGLTFFFQRKFKGKFKDVFFLMYVLSSGTVIWGAVTGTWFGFENIAQLPFFNLLVINRIDSFVRANQFFMIHLCFLIGAVHLSIAHAIVAFRFSNSFLALAQVGWIGIVWTAFFLAGMLVLDRPLPDFTLTLGSVGVGLVILFSNPQKNILKGMLLSLADLPLKLISSFSDVVSYLRLFAVGYASVAVATTFNNMAFANGINSILSGFVAVLVLFLGHSLNILLGLMAVIVHGIRLNMLEFSGHLNMQWSGKEYKPFKE